MICGKEAENQGSDLQSLHDHLLFHQMQQHNFINFPSEITQIFPPPWPPAVRHHDPNFLLPPPYGSFNHRKMQFGYDYAPSPAAAAADHHLRMISESLGGGGGGGSVPFGLGAELGKMTAQEIMDAKALAASKSHSEAERRRRERINNHLAKLRSLLPSTTKTDKASLLAEVIQHVKDLKRQTSLIAETSPVPTEVDELTVDTADEDGRFVIRASLCCDDRSDLLPDLIKTLKALRLRTLKAEITTLGGRVRNVLFITGDDQDDDGDVQESSSLEYGYDQYSITSIQEALKAVMDRAANIGGAEHHHQQHESSSSGSVKRQRTNNVSHVNIQL